MKPRFPYAKIPKSGFKSPPDIIIVLLSMMRSLAIWVSLDVFWRVEHGWNTKRSRILSSKSCEATKKLFQENFISIGQR
jgi:hypothetical protein